MIIYSECMYWFTVLNDGVDGLMINAIRMSQKKKNIRQWENKLWYCFKTSQRKKVWGRRETGIGREKGRALQSKTLPEFFSDPIHLSTFAAR
jgi:hypothetical protein